jgi:hypothetical protein
MRSLIATALFASLAACTGGGTMSGDDTAPYNCAAETRADAFFAGMHKAGAGNALDFALMTADPAPPARGDNTWNIQMSAMTSGVVGNGVAGATLTVTPFMPDHQHGSPIEVEITDKGGGAYELSPVNLWMPGLWQTTIQATSASGSDSAVFAFCIPE